MESRQKRAWTPERRSAASARMKGRKLSKATRKKMSESAMYVPHSEETKAKISASKKAFHARKKS